MASCDAAVVVTGVKRPNLRVLGPIQAVQGILGTVTPGAGHSGGVVGGAGIAQLPVPARSRPSPSARVLERNAPPQASCACRRGRSKMLGADIKATAMPQSVFTKAKRSETVYTLPLAQGPTEPTVAKVVLARTLSTRHSSLGLSGSSSASQQAGSSLSSSLQISSGPAGS